MFIKNLLPKALNGLYLRAGGIYKNPNAA